MLNDNTLLSVRQPKSHSRSTVSLLEFNMRPPASAPPVKSTKLMVPLTLVNLAQNSSVNVVRFDNAEPAFVSVTVSPVVKSKELFCALA